MASQTTQPGEIALSNPHDAEDIGRDVMHAATTYPVASLFVLGAIVIGGSMLVAAMLRDDGPREYPGQSSGVLSLASAAKGLGPKATETVSRIRDAVFSFALDRAVEKVEELFPGFREHYQRA